MYITHIALFFLCSSVSFPLTAIILFIIIFWMDVRGNTKKEDLLLLGLFFY